MEDLPGGPMLRPPGIAPTEQDQKPSEHSVKDPWGYTAVFLSRPSTLLTPWSHMDCQP